MNLWGLGNLGSPIPKKFQRALSVEVRDWRVGYPTDQSGCGHEPVGGDGGDEEDGGDEGENISQSSSPSHCTSEPQSFVREKGGLLFVDSL